MTANSGAHTARNMPNTPKSAGLYSRVSTGAANEIASMNRKQAMHAQITMRFS